MIDEIALIRWLSGIAKESIRGLGLIRGVDIATRRRHGITETSAQHKFERGSFQDVDCHGAISTLFAAVTRVPRARMEANLNPRRSALVRNLYFRRARLSHLWHDECFLDFSRAKGPRR